MLSPGFKTCWPDTYLRRPGERSRGDRPAPLQALPHSAVHARHAADLRSVGSKSTHQRLLRKFVGLRVLGNDGRAWLEEQAVKAAQTKQELADIINVLLEELEHHRCACTGGHLFDPYEQNTQQSPDFGRSTALQRSHS